MLRLSDDRPPVPPPDLILRVAPPFEPAEAELGQQSFDLAGIEHLRRFESALAALGRSFTDFKRLLDFGCGCGRFIRHLGSISDAVEVHGTDIDAEMIDWLRANVPYGQYVVGPHEPPLHYPDHHFDVVINHSVFSHLDERLQDLWLGELQRITRPGALLLLTVEGESSWNRTVAAAEGAGEDVERWQEELETRGILYIADDQYIGSTHPDFYHSTVHAPWYVFEHWSRFFDIACFIPDGSLSQDLIVLRRRDDGVSPRPIVGRRTPAAAPPYTPARRRFRSQLTGASARVEEMVRAWRGVRPPPAGPNSVALPAHRSADIRRELSMLRVGLYEQGRRITVLGAELRREIDEVRNGAEHGSGADEREA